MTEKLLGDFLSEEQFAAEIHKTVRTVQRWRAQRIGPPVTFIGKTPHYNKGSAQQWLRSRKRRPARKP